jgi:hypothetical protein
MFKGKSTKFNEFKLSIEFKKWNASRDAEVEFNISKQLQSNFEEYANKVMTGLSTLCETYVSALSVLVSNLGFIFEGNNTLVRYFIDNNEDYLMQAYSGKAIIFAVRKKCKRRLDNGDKAVITYPKVTHVANEKDRSANGDSFLAEEGYFYDYLLDNEYIDRSTNKLTEPKCKVFDNIKKSADTLECGIPVCSLSKAKFTKILELHNVIPFRTPSVVVDKYADCRVGLTELEELEQRIKEDKQHKQKEIIQMKKKNVPSEESIQSEDIEVLYNDEKQTMAPIDVTIIRHYLVNEGYVHLHLLNLNLSKADLVEKLRKSTAVVNGIAISSIDMPKLEEVMIRSNIGVYDKKAEEFYESHKDLFIDDSFAKHEDTRIVPCHIDYKFDGYNFTVKDLEGYHQDRVNECAYEYQEYYWQNRDKYHRCRGIDGNNPEAIRARKEMDDYNNLEYTEDGYDVIRDSARFNEGYYDKSEINDDPDEGKPLVIDERIKGLMDLKNLMKNDPDYDNNRFIREYTNGLKCLGEMSSFNSYYWDCIEESKSNKNLAVKLESLDDFYSYAFDRACQYILNIQREMIKIRGRRLNGIEMAYINAEIHFTIEHIAFELFDKDNENYLIKNNDKWAINCDYAFHSLTFPNKIMYQNKETNAHICLDCIIKNSLIRAFPFDTLLNASKRHHTDYSEF